MNTINELFDCRIDTMTRDAQGIVETRSEFGYQAPHYLQKEYAEGLEFTPTQAFKSSTHLGITIRWGGPRCARPGRVRSQGAG